MDSYRYIFSTVLHSKLKEKIIGKIFTRITNDDTLFISIINCDDNEFVMEFNNISEKILHGWSTDYAVYEVVNKYQKYITNRVMKKYFV